MGIASILFFFLSSFFAFKLYTLYHRKAYLFLLNGDAFDRKIHVQVEKQCLSQILSAAENRLILVYGT